MRALRGLRHRQSSESSVAVPRESGTALTVATASSRHRMDEAVAIMMVARLAAHGRGTDPARALAPRPPRAWQRRRCEGDLRWWRM